MGMNKAYELDTSSYTTIVHISYKATYYIRYAVHVKYVIIYL